MQPTVHFVALGCASDRPSALENAPELGKLSKVGRRMTTKKTAHLVGKTTMMRTTVVVAVVFVMTKRRTAAVGSTISFGNFASECAHAQRVENASISLRHSLRLSIFVRRTTTTTVAAVVLVDATRTTTMKAVVLARRTTRQVGVRIPHLETKYTETYMYVKFNKYHSILFISRTQWRCGCVISALAHATRTTKMRIAVIVRRTTRHVNSTSMTAIRLYTKTKEK